MTFTTQLFQLIWADAEMSIDEVDVDHAFNESAEVIAVELADESFIYFKDQDVQVSDAGEFTAKPFDFYDEMEDGNELLPVTFTARVVTSRPITKEDI